MTDLDLSNTQTIRYIIAGLCAWIAAMLAGCGISTPGGTVIGSTGFLEVVKAAEVAPMDLHSKEDKRALNDQLRRY